MKVLLAKGRFLGPISGADEVLVSYAIQLRRHGHEVTVVLMYPHSPGDPYASQLADAGVPLAAVAPARVHTTLEAAGRLLRRGLELFPATQPTVRRRVRRLATAVAARYHDPCRQYFAASGADLVHVMTPDPSAMVMIQAAHEARLPVLYQELGKPFHPPAFASYYEQFTSVLPLCAEVAALSPLLAAECREKLPGIDGVSVLPAMTEVEGDASSAADDDGGDRDDGDSDDGDAVTFGFAGRIEALKGPTTLVDGFAAALRSQSDLRLMLAGAGPQKRDVETRARRLGVADRCRFLPLYAGPQQKRAFLRHVDVFVLPSLTEGTPTSLIEAMAHGVPVIATPVGGIPDLVAEDTGLLVPPEDVEALGEAMTRVAGDAELRAQMGKAARRRYEELFAPSAVVPLMDEIYRRVAGRPPAGSPDGGGTHPWATGIP